MLFEFFMQLERQFLIIIVLPRSWRKCTMNLAKKPADALFQRNFLPSETPTDTKKSWKRLSLERGCQILTPTLHSSGDLNKFVQPRANVPQI
jgi:hypothetical protein